jgi:hypothetical protein
MTFSEQSKKILEYEKELSKRNKEEYNKILLYFENLERLNKLKNEKSVEYLYNELIKQDCKFNFKIMLGINDYFSANSFAYECLEIDFDPQNVPPKKVPSWTRCALKCFDHLLIKYINDILNEKIENRRGKNNYETDVYIHLENKGGDYQIIGLNFHDIYRERCRFEHLQIQDSEGKRQIKKISNKKYKERLCLILDLFYKALDMLLVFIKEAFPSATIL